MVDRQQQMKEFDELLKLMSFNENEEVSVSEAIRTCQRQDIKREEKNTTGKRNRERMSNCPHCNGCQKTKNDIADKVVPNAPSEVVGNTKLNEESIQEGKYEGEDASKGETHTQVDLPNELAGNKEFNYPIFPTIMLPPRRRIKVNLRSLKIPMQLPPEHEKLMNALRTMLWYNGFDVTDRATLAYFAIGNQENINAAFTYFLEFYKFACISEVKNPTRAKMPESLTEGVACQPDGSLGIYFNAGNWVPYVTKSNYVAREIFCYVLNFVTFPILNSGYTLICNVRDLEWKKFMPYESTRVTNYMIKSIPLEPRRVLFVEPNYYASLAMKVFIPMIPNKLTNVASLISIDECDLNILSPSLSGEATDQPEFKYFSTDHQFDFQILIES